MADRPARPMSHSYGAILCLLATFGALSIGHRSSDGSELRNTAIVRAYQGARGSVVNLRGEKTVTPVGPAGQIEPTRRVNGMGTGVVIDPRGYVVTNYHVVDGVREIHATLADGARCNGRLVKRDVETDLAIIKLDAAQPLPVIKIGTSSDLMPGEPVLAIGNAYGYENTVTRGIISALHRSVQVSDAQHYDDLIQTDAAINPGNSGGPLLNIDGEMIGINVAVRAGANLIGFAIPVDKVMDVATDLMAAQAGERAWTGVKLKKLYDPAGPQGAVVADVEEKSPAEAAGLKAGDVITQVGATKTERSLDFPRALLDRNPGEPVEVLVRRGDENIKLTLTPTRCPGRGPVWETLGLELKPIPTEKFQQEYRTQYRGGLLITAVRTQSPASAQGLHRGDVLVGLHIWETVSPENVAYVLNRPDFDTFTPLRFIILRGKDSFFGYLPVSMAETKRE